MKHILDPAHRPALASFAEDNSLLALDYDGVLAPIVTKPTQALMRPMTKSLMETAARLYPTVVISGRAREDVIRRLEGIEVGEVAGNHGIEPWYASEEVARHARAWIPNLMSALSGLDGVEL